ncbi:hypothetical protein [Paracoccus sp. AK26]|uniref:hypothetical protein n=1 Tax=Paracoccus sp. AK26 TaxID=2589076 RepID=UPI0014287764|nr:hypothetical protein [Paracoccus sp. AK26]QIR85061.1 hypothetical protein FIU66_07475 [Paracoccus sp. AK26]
MANTTIDAPRGLSWGSLAAPFLAIGRFLVLIAEASPKVRQLERLNAQSDAQLAARGLTRDGEVRRILGISAAV